MTTILMETLVAGDVIEVAVPSPGRGGYGCIERFLEQSEHGLVQAQARLPASGLDKAGNIGRDIPPRDHFHPHRLHVTVTNCRFPAAGPDPVSQVGV